MGAFGSSKKGFGAWPAAVAALFLSAGCMAPPDAPVASKECALGEWKRDDGSCQPAGLPLDMQCPPGELALEGGGCQPAGIPPDACGKGFMPDGKQGCEPILPAEECPVGTMAVPGETECHEVAPCGQGTWGDIPVEANTEFVDQSYPGNDSDGSMTKPWKTVQKGIDAAAKGAIVAVAAGTYQEDVMIYSKWVRLWGRCPAMVTISGAGAAEATLVVLNKLASGTEVRQVAVTGTVLAVGMQDVTTALLDRVWIHDSAEEGLFVNTVNVPTSVTLNGSLVEHNTDTGIEILGSDITIEATVIRDQVSPSGAYGSGLYVLDSSKTSAPANLTMRGSVVEKNQEAGLIIRNSKAAIEDTVVRQTQPNGKGEHGSAMAIQNRDNTDGRSNVSIRGSLFADNHWVGMNIVNSDVVVETSMIRGTQPDKLGASGVGVQVGGDAAANQRSALTIRASVVERNAYSGINIFSSDATLETTIVRENRSLPTLHGGIGIAISDHPQKPEASNVNIFACVVEQNQDTGVYIGGSTATLDSTVVRFTKPNDQGLFGYGIRSVASFYHEESATNTTIRNCQIEANRIAGVAFGISDALVETSMISDTAPDDDGNYGDGIEAESANISLDGVLITKNARAGIANFSSTIVVSGSTMTCNAIDVEGETLVGAPFSYAGSSGWACSKRGASDCNEVDECTVQSVGLEPPPPPDPPAPPPF